MRKLFNKLKIPAAGLLLAVGMLFSVNGLVTEAGARDCTSNAVIKCGVTSMGELRDKYAKDYTKGTKNIFSYFGLNSNVINNATYKRGTAYNNGDIYVGGKKVATGAHSAGREHRAGGTKRNVNGTTFYTSPLSVWNLQTWDVFVFYDKNGRFLSAVMLICGNPVSAKPVEPPKPPKPQPVYACSSLSRLKQDNPNKYVFVGKSRVEHGAKHKGFTFDFGDGSATKYVAVQRTSDAGKYGYGEIAHTYAKAGTYNVKVTAHFTVNGKEVTATAANCQKPVTIPKKEVPPTPKPKNPGVSIDKQVRADKDSGMTKEEALEQARNFKPTGNCTTVMTPAVHVETGATYTFTSGCLPAGWVAERNYTGETRESSRTTTGWVEHVKLDVNQEFDYRLVVKNTGEVTLKNARVTDPAPNGIEFLSADKGAITNGQWSYTIPELKVGQSLTVVIKAKVTEYQSGKIVNTACVDAREIPGDKDDCDDATVEVEKPPVTPPAPEPEPEPEMVKVCDTKTNEIVEVTEDQLEDNPERYTTDLTKCEDKPEVPEIPAELPQTGLGLALNGLAGIGTLTAAGYYYISSRRL